jgi:hypothetical protein
LAYEGPIDGGEAPAPGREGDGEGEGEDDDEDVEPGRGEDGAVKGGHPPCAGEAATREMLALAGGDKARNRFIAARVRASFAQSHPSMSTMHMPPPTP